MKIYVIHHESTLNNEFFSELIKAFTDRKDAENYIESEISQYNFENVLDSPTVNYEYAIETLSGDYFGWNIEEIELLSSFLK